MLSMSARSSGDDVNLNGIVAGNDVATGIPGSRALLAFAEICLGDDTAAISGARQQVLHELGEAAMVDAACIIANFQRMVRIADGRDDAAIDCKIAGPRLRASTVDDVAVANYQVVCHPALRVPFPGKAYQCRKK